MKTKTKKFSTTLLALAGLALLSSGAQANQTLSNYDVFVGFRSTTSPNNAVLFNVGNVSQFTNSANFANFSFGSSGTTGADLVQQFGSGWYTDSTVTWGIFSALTGSYALASKAETVNGTQSSPYAALNTAKTGNLITGINTVQNNYITSTAATNTANAAYQQGVASGTYYYAVNLNPDFTSTAWPSGSSIEGALSKNLDLYYFTPSSVQVLGGGNGASLAVNSNGVISAVPEPSTYFLFGLGALGFVLAVRRRSSSTL
ncbi:MAG: PEP-CTERM sorting domain-containing protein [bacterium]